MSDTPAIRSSLPRPAAAARNTDLEDELGRRRLIAVIVAEDPSDADPLADALACAGLRFAEVTLRTPAALDVLRRMAAADLIVGAGTVTMPGQVDAAVDAGARFIVTPGFSQRVTDRCHERSCPVIPGVITATEVMMATEAGAQVLKFFPAHLSGGVAALSALHGPFPAARFVPTGGITETSMGEYLAHPAVLAVGGSWMVAADLIRGRRWSTIADLSAAAVLAAAGG